MAAFLNACRFNPAAGGTTDWTYSSPVPGYQTPTAAGAITGTAYKYRAESADLSQWELGEGAYNSGTGTFARTTVLFNSSGTTSKINFSMVPQVAIVALAEDIAGLSSNNTLTGTQNVTNTTDASSTTAGGAFTIAGGLAVAKKFYAGAASFFTGIASFLSGTASTSTTTGAVVVTGGIGVSGDVNAGGIGVNRTPGSGLAQFGLANQGLAVLSAGGSIKIANGLAYGALFITEQLNTGATGTFLLAGGVATLTTQNSVGYYSSGNASPATGAAIGHNGVDTFLFNATGSPHNYNWMLFRIG
jgi:hypothetical protein